MQNEFLFIANKNVGVHCFPKEKK